MPLPASVKTLFWYDLETTGIDSIRDRPLQFAGIRTDESLNEIGDPLNFLCRPGDDVVPSPDALLVTGIRMSDIADHGLIERDFAALIMGEFSQADTCVVGFNSIRFDDEFVRQMFYRNFHDPYAREWRGGNSRWDVIDLFRMAYALRPEGLSWPEREPGIPSFRLEDLAHANGLAHENAHDALADVRTTIEMTRRVRQAQPKLYDYLFRLREKKAVLQQLYPLGKQAVVHVSSMYPARRGCTAVVLPLCQHPTNNNGIICFDLSAAPDGLLEANAEELSRLVFSRTDELEAGEDRIPLKTIHINRAPAVAPLGTLTPAAASRLQIDLTACEAHRLALQHQAGLVEKIQDAFAAAVFPEKEDPDDLLYGGPFFADSDRNVMTEVVASDPGKLAGFAGRFQDDRLDEMLFRYRARNWPGQLTPAEVERWNAFRRERWEQGALLVAAEARRRELLAEPSLSADDRAVLDDLGDYLGSLQAGIGH